MDDQMPQKEKKVYDEILIKEIFFAESDNISHRTDWFLIFHGVLLQAYCSVHALHQKLILGTLGLLTAFLWLMSGIRTFKLLWQAGSYLNDNEIAGNKMADTFKKIYAERRTNINNRFYGWARPAPLFSIITPIIIFFVWFFMLASEISRVYMAVLAVSFLVMVFVIARFATFVEDREGRKNAARNPGK